VLPYVLTSSDDMLIKLWDWDKGWACVQVFEGHSHYVMQVRRALIFLVGWGSMWGRCQ
jgi:WD40 repeat protein